MAEEFEPSRRLADDVRTRRAAVDQDLERLRMRMQEMKPRRVDARRWASTALPFVAGTAAFWLWRRRRRSMASLQDLLVYELRDLYHIEQQLLPALDRMVSHATHPELRQALEQHRRQTEAHVERLERAFRSVDARPTGGTSAAVAGIIAESERMLKSTSDTGVRDAWLIAAAQRVEHVEMAAYGNARAYAETLGYTYLAQLLDQTLEEERAADEKLTHVAERFVNPETMRKAG